jgi:adenylosuccinate lyase
LRINKDAMKRNLDLTGGLVFSQRIMLELTKKGLSREKAYQIVQDTAMESKQNDKRFKDLILEHREINKYMKMDEIYSCFDYNYYIRNIDYIYQRVYKEN